MNYTKAILFIISFTISLLFFSCEKGAEPDEIKPSRRDYVWTEDTLYNPPKNIFLTFRHIVGNRPDDVWIGTHFSDSPTGLWHFDGLEWKVAQSPSLGTTKSALFIFKDNTLFVGNGYNQIVKRENGEWSEPFDLVVEGYKNISIYDIYGISKDNIFAIGVAYNFSTSTTPYKQVGIIFHFNGIEWKVVETPDYGPLDTIKYHNPTQKYYIYASGDESDNFEDILIEFDGVVTRKSEFAKFGTALSEINGVVYLSSNKKVYKLNSDTLFLWKDFSGTDYQTNFVGRSESDFINRSSRGLGHYNGTDYQTIYETDLEIQNFEMIENHIFALGVDYRNQHFIVIHGVLEE